MLLIAAPSNLGLRPLRPGHEPGTWRAPQAMVDAGLLDALGHPEAIWMKRPIYSPDKQPGTEIRNGHAIRTFNLELADHVERARCEGKFPIVLGGDCSILLGALAGICRHSPCSLVHIDGHSDFRHPGNYDPASMLGAAAGMDLAIVTGRGEPLATQWPRIAGPLVEDHHVVQIGERESRDADFAWPDINDTQITCIDVFQAREIGATAVVRRANEVIDKASTTGFWLHLDIDVLDQTVMPAVDSPGSPGIDLPELERILSKLIRRGDCVGMTVTVFDPDLDPDGTYAKLLVSLLAALPLR